LIKDPLTLDNPHAKNPLTLDHPQDSQWGDKGQGQGWSPTGVADDQSPLSLTLNALSLNNPSPALSPSEYPPSPHSPGAAENSRKRADSMIDVNAASRVGPTFNAGGARRAGNGSGNRFKISDMAARTNARLQNMDWNRNNKSNNNNNRNDNDNNTTTDNTSSNWMGATANPRAFSLGADPSSLLSAPSPLVGSNSYLGGLSGEFSPAPPYLIRYLASSSSSCSTTNNQQPLEPHVLKFLLSSSSEQDLGWGQGMGQ
jgi:hypothetical protein